MDSRTMSLGEIRQRFDSSPYSQRIVRRRTKWAAILVSIGALVGTASLGMVESGWHTFLIPAMVLLAANLAWILYFQLDQKEAILSLVDHIEKLEERIEFEKPEVQEMGG